MGVFTAEKINQINLVTSTHGTVHLQKHISLGVRHEPNFQFPNALIFGMNMSAGSRLGVGTGTGARFYVGLKMLKVARMRNYIF